jgi:hypothetical protein
MAKLAAGEPWIRSDVISAYRSLPREVIQSRANIVRALAQRRLAASEKRPGSNLGKRYMVDFRHRSKV